MFSRNSKKEFSFIRFSFDDAAECESWQRALMSATSDALSNMDEKFGKPTTEIDVALNFSHKMLADKILILSFRLAVLFKSPGGIMSVPIVVLQILNGHLLI